MFTSPLFVIAADYHAMFSGILKALGPENDKVVKGLIDNEITWAKQTLKKSDRIVWYLRWYRIYLIVRAEINKDFEPAVLKPGTLNKELAALSGKAGSPITKQDILAVKDSAALSQVKRWLQHFLSLEDAGIQQAQFAYQTPLALETEFSTLEQEYKAKADEDSRSLEPQDGDEVFIKFGNGWAWWGLSRGECSMEAKAMGHCGNQGEVTGDQIISLREPRKTGGKDYWSPHLTFIFDKASGFLGEMKGRGNDKPAKRYHPYIISLLKDPRIKGIKGGGYKPSHNFNMLDLSEEERTELENEKPQLMTLAGYLKKMKVDVHRFGPQNIDQYISDKIKAIVGLQSNYDAEKGGWILETWDSLEKFVEDKGDKSARWLLGYTEGGDYLEINESGYRDNDMLNSLHDLPKESISAMGKELEATHPDELLDFIEQQGGADEFEWEPDLLGDVRDFIEYLNEQGIDSKPMEDLRTAYQYAAEAGTQDRMSKALRSAVEDATDEDDYVKVIGEGTSIYNGKIYATLQPREALKAALTAENEQEGDYGYDTPFAEHVLETLKVKADSERDYSDFDDKTVTEYMTGEWGKGAPVVEEAKPEPTPVEAPVEQPAAEEDEEPIPSPKEFRRQQGWD